MDLEARQELRAVIEKLTHSGAPSLDKELVKKVKTTCKQGDPYIRTAYDSVLHDLEAKHAEIRLSAFQLANELFIRSSLFRELLVTDFKKFAVLVTGTDPKHPLPPPKDAAARLKKSSLLAIKEWNQKYGRGYPKLQLGFNYLKFNRKVDFEELVSRDEAERRRREEREARQATILQQRIQEVKQEILDLKRDIDGCLTELEACFNLLLPRFELPDIYSSTTSQDTNTSQDTAQNGSQDTNIGQDASQDMNTSQDTSSGAQEKADSEQTFRKRTVSSGGSFVSLSEGSGSEWEETTHQDRGNDRAEGHSPLQIRTTPDVGSDSDSEVEWEEVEPLSGGGRGVDMQEHGLAGHGFSVPVQLSSRVEVKETEDNSSILDTLRERRNQLLHHLLPALNKCLEWMTKAGEGASVRTIIDMKNKVSTALTKYNRLNITYLEPLPAEKQTPEAQPGPPKTKIVETETEWKFGANVPKSVSSAELELDPTTPQAQLAILKKRYKAPVSATGQSQSSESQRDEESGSTSNLKTRAPVIPFGMDLYHWENSSSSVEPRTLAPVGSLHRFWAQETEVNISKDEQERLKCRTISFPGHFQPVMKSCRAPLPSGKLCPRKDRHKCPFHGPIISRDEHGNPVDSGASLALGQAPSLDSSRGEGDSQPPLWEDPELQREIMAATGAELGSSKGKKKERKGKRKLKDRHPGLTDLEAEVDTPRKRLEKKVLNKRSMKRVAESVNKLTSKKYNDKFGDSFHYALKN